MEPSTARQAVRGELVELGFASYEFVGQCVEVLMADVARAIDPPLGEREAEVHALLYSGQDYVLCWPLILLAEKLEFWEARSVI